CAPCSESWRSCCSTASASSRSARSRSATGSGTPRWRRRCRTWWGRARKLTREGRPNPSPLSPLPRERERGRGDGRASRFTSTTPPHPCPSPPRGGEGMSLVPHREPLIMVLGRLELVDHRHRIIFHRDAALAVGTDEQMILAQTERPRPLAGRDEGRGR